VDSERIVFDCLIESMITIVSNYLVASAVDERIDLLVETLMRVCEKRDLPLLSRLVHIRVGSKVEKLVMV